MDPRRLGNHGPLVSPIGFGAFKIGRNQGAKYGVSYALPSEAEVSQLLNGLLDAGINYLDTAPAYGVSEERIGATIAHRRAEFVLSTKVGETFENGASTFDFTRAAVVASVHRSLQRLRTDVLDFVFVHSNGDDLNILTQTDVVAVLQELKAAGHVRGLGFSGKTVAGAEAALAWADALMVEYHLDDVSHRDVIAAAAQRGIGVVIKKGLSSGRLDPLAALKFVLSDPGISTLIVGSLSLDHMRENLRLAQSL